jgi:hypothetical protein
LRLGRFFGMEAQFWQKCGPMPHDEGQVLTIGSSLRSTSRRFATRKAIIRSGSLNHKTALLLLRKPSPLHNIPFRRKTHGQAKDQLCGSGNDNG